MNTEKTYTLHCTEINTKSAKFHYQIMDETGAIISDRKSDRIYMAATIDGGNYFGRVDLAHAFVRQKKAKGFGVPEIAYIKQ